MSFFWFVDHHAAKSRNCAFVLSSREHRGNLDLESEDGEKAYLVCVARVVLVCEASGGPRATKEQRFTNLVDPASSHMHLRGFASEVHSQTWLILPVVICTAAD
jgi:hypothetical protein